MQEKTVTQLLHRALHHKLRMPRRTGNVANKCNKDSSTSLLQQGKSARQIIHNTSHDQCTTLQAIQQIIKGSASAENAAAQQGIQKTVDTSGNWNKVTRLHDGESSSLQTRGMVNGTINKVQPAQSTGHSLQCRKNGN